MNNINSNVKFNLHDRSFEIETIAAAAKRTLMKVERLADRIEKTRTRDDAFCSRYARFRLCWSDGAQTVSELSVRKGPSYYCGGSYYEKAVRMQDAAASVYAAKALLGRTEAEVAWIVQKAREAENARIEDEENAERIAAGKRYAQAKIEQLKKQYGL